LFAVLFYAKTELAIVTPDLFFNSAWLDQATSLEVWNYVYICWN